MIVKHPHLKQSYPRDKESNDGAPFLNTSSKSYAPSDDTSFKTTSIQTCENKKILSGESLIFLKQWIKNPGRLGTLAPISNRLAQKAAACIENPSHQRVVEIGAGPGRLTRALLHTGIQPHNFKAIELDPNLCAYAQQSLPHIDFIEGDAASLPLLLPKDWIKKVDIVFSTIPFMYLAAHKRTDIVNAAFNVLKPGGILFHLTYYWGNPLQHMMLDASRATSVWFNAPPAFIWRYQHPVRIETLKTNLKAAHLQPAP